MLWVYFTASNKQNDLRKKSRFAVQRRLDTPAQGTLARHPAKEEYGCRWFCGEGRFLCWQKKQQPTLITRKGNLGSEASTTLNSTLTATFFLVAMYCDGFLFWFPAGCDGSQKSSTSQDSDELAPWLLHFLSGHPPPHLNHVTNNPTDQTTHTNHLASVHVHLWTNKTSRQHWYDWACWPW